MDPIDPGIFRGCMSHASRQAQHRERGGVKGYRRPCEYLFQLMHANRAEGQNPAWAGTGFARLRDSTRFGS